MLIERRGQMLNARPGSDLEQTAFRFYAASCARRWPHKREADRHAAGAVDGRDSSPLAGVLDGFCAQRSFAIRGQFKCRHEILLVDG